MKLVVFDVETKKAFDEVGGFFPEKLGVSISCVYFRNDENSEEWYKAYREEQFSEMFKLFEIADRIVGFNSISFDLAALAPYYVGNLKTLPSLDIMVELEKKLGHRVSLDAVAKETLGIQKNGHGLDAIRYFHDGDWESLEKYCLQDVKVTKELYDYGVARGKLRFKNKWNEIVTVEIDFGYNELNVAKVQTTLF
ncbi:MAG: ribonuclease H-like domain-containing protein [bacterium]